MIKFFVIPITFFFLYCPILCAESVDSYLNDLQYGTPELRAEAISNLSKTKKTDYIEIILNYLKDPEPQVRISAAKGLLTLNAKRTIPNLIEALADTSVDVCKEIRLVLVKFDDKDSIRETLKTHSNPNVRQQIVVLMGESGDTGYLPDLIAGAKDNDLIRFSVVDAFTKLRDKSVIPILIEFLSDPVGDIRIASARSLAEFNAYKSVPGMLRLLDDTDPIVKNGITEILDKLVSQDTELYYTEGLLKDKSMAVRRYCVRALGLLGDRAVLPLLFAVIKDKDPSVREEVIKSLDALVDSSFVFSLCLALNEKDVRVRKYVIEALTKIKDPRAVPSLLTVMTKENEPELVELIKTAVITIADSSVYDYLKLGIRTKNKNIKLTVIDYTEKNKVGELLPALVNMLITEKDMEIKLAVLNVLRSIPDNNVLPELHKLLEVEKDSGLKSSIISVLKVFNDNSSIPSLMNTLRDSDELTVLDAEELLDKLASEKNLVMFCEAVKDDSLRIKSYAMKIIKRFPLSMTLPYVLIAVNDRDTFLRKDAIEVLGIIGDKSTIDLVGKAIKDSNEEIRIAAIKSLAQIGDPSVTKFAAQLLRDKSANVKLEAMKVLEQYEDKDSVSLIIKMLKSEQDPTVRESAIILLQKFGNKELIPIFLRLVKDVEPAVRKASVIALGDFGDSNVVPLLRDIMNNDFATEVKLAAMKSLGKLGAREIIPDLLSNLYGQTKDINKTAMESLDMLVNEDNYPYFLSNINNDHKEVRQYCLNVLSRIKSNDAVKEMFGLLKTAKPDIRPQLMKILSESTDSTYLSDYTSVIDNPSVNNDIELQIWVLKNLARLKSKESTSYLAEVLRHRQDAVREEAVNTLKIIGLDNQTKKILEYMADSDPSLAIKRAARDVLNKK
jgi:HEAT repeat protein